MGLLRPEDWQAQWIGVRETAQPEASPPGKLHIIRAVYQSLDGKHGKDVTDLLASRVDGDVLVFKVDNAAMGGDPAPNTRKKLVVEYELAGQRLQRSVAENEVWSLNHAAPQEWPVPRYLRKPFTLARKVRRATIHATALGLYELLLNGQRVGDHLLAPEWTNYHKRVQYQTYDVTGMLRDGNNVVGAVLGNGWYCGGWQNWKKKLLAIYGSEPYLLAQLEIEFADGSRQVIATDGTWRGTTDGPLRFAGIYEGATYDARKEMAGWDKPGLEDGKWTAVHLPDGDLKVGQLVWQRNEPIRVTGGRHPIRSPSRSRELCL